jgi:hypothetical protein
MITNKKPIDFVYLHLAIAFFLIVLDVFFDGLHPWANLAAGILILKACYYIGRLKKK